MMCRAYLDGLWSYILRPFHTYVPYLKYISFIMNTSSFESNKLWTCWMMYYYHFLTSGTNIIAYTMFESTRFDKWQVNFVKHWTFQQIHHESISNPPHLLTPVFVCDWFYCKAYIAVIERTDNLRTINLLQILPVLPTIFLKCVLFLQSDPARSIEVDKDESYRNYQLKTSLTDLC